MRIIKIKNSFQNSATSEVRLALHTHMPASNDLLISKRYTQYYMLFEGEKKIERDLFDNFIDVLLQPVNLNNGEDFKEYYYNDELYILSTVKPFLKTMPLDKIEDVDSVTSIYNLKQ